MFETYINFFKKIFLGMHFSENVSRNISEGISLLTLFAISILAFYLVHLIIKKTIYLFIKKTESKRDDLIIKNKVFKRLCMLIPAYMIRYFIPTAIPDFPRLFNIIILFTKIYEILIYARVIDAIASTLYDIYNTYEISKNKPIKGILQIIKIVIYIICLLLIFALLTNKKLSSILIGLGTLSAILMLVFKDPILGFVGSIQLSINDMIRIGDWIVMNKNNADGEVLEIGLTTVKVKNWDNTITTIPTYSLISEAFTNWRGMSESGGRRIARSIIIDALTIKFCTTEMLERYKKIQLVTDYITNKEADIEKYNKENNIDTSNLVNGRHQTNFGIFREYLREYLMSNPNINHSMTLMIRQLAPTEFGIPLQVYAFSSNKEWIIYENIQSDIFDHILAVVPMFDLKVYQRSSGNTSVKIPDNVKNKITN